MIKSTILLLILCATSLAQAAGFYELDFDWNSPGKQVATATVGGSVGQFIPMFVIDSTGYYEGFVGHSTKLGAVSVTAHFGVEGLKGMNPRPRGLVITSARFESMNALVVNEFGGVTGNFHKERLWVDVGRYGFGAVNHSSAGFGLRIDYRLTPSTTLYLQPLKRGDSIRLTLAITGTF